jgi:hypothetical protein
MPLDKLAVYRQRFLWLTLRNKKTCERFAQKQSVRDEACHTAQKHFGFMASFTLDQTQSAATINETALRQQIARALAQQALRTFEGLLEVASSDEHFMPLA